MNTLNNILKNTSELPEQFTFGCQLEKVSQRVTKSQKPYYELSIVDALSQTSLKVWDNHPQFHEALQLKLGKFLVIEGAFSKSQYGLESSAWQWSSMGADQIDVFLLGDPALKATQEQDYSEIEAIVAEIADPRLGTICKRYLAEFGDRFRRAAAAKKNHHARRGGLVEHVAQMMRSAKAIGGAYGYLNTDLIIAGVLFHDAGKLWENNYAEQGFQQNVSFHAEALGHINLGIELVNRLWKEMVVLDEYKHWKELSPSNEQVRIHLLHLIASHHGTLEFGSPVLPKTPEAYALHFIDNLDAKMEMFKNGYEESSSLSSQVLERKFPLSSNILISLSSFQKETI